MFISLENVIMRQKEAKKKEPKQEVSPIFDSSFIIISIASFHFVLICYVNIKGGKINIIPIENEFKYDLMKGFMDIWMEMHSNGVVLYVSGM